MNIGATIKRLRKEKKLNQEKFGEMCGITQTALSQIETGVSYPHKSNLDKICEVLKVSEAYLILISITREDVPESKRDVFDKLFPPVKQLLDNIFLEDE